MIELFGYTLSGRDIGLIAVVKRIPEAPYRWFIILMTAIAASLLLFNPV